YMRRWPRGRSRHGLYNTLVHAHLRFHPRWQVENPILFVRHSSEALYWSKKRTLHKRWFKILEAHDLYILPNLKGLSEHQKRLEARRGFLGFDLIIALTGELAEDIRDLTDNQVPIEVMPLCS